MGTALMLGVAVLVSVPLLGGAEAEGFASSFGLGASASMTVPAESEVVIAGPSIPSAPLPVVAPDMSWPWGQCTWFVAQHHRVTWGGDAAAWLQNAAAQGVRTTHAPSVGAIVVYRPGGDYNAEDGHVAFVIAVAPTTYTVAEMNYVKLGVEDERTLAWPDTNVLGFIP